jgi:hypothetical protein
VFGIVALLAAGIAQAAPPSGGAPAPEAAKAATPLACNLGAMTPAQRRRHFEIVGPELREREVRSRELPDGFEFEFKNDTQTFRLLSEWVLMERRCCPFFVIEIRSESEGGPLRLRLAGREGVKDFIRREGAEWLKK